MKSSIQMSIEIEVPVQTAYNRWTQFEEFPRFMPTVRSVDQIDDRHLHWLVKVGGRTQDWDAEIVEQLPDKRIAWKSLNGPVNSGVVTFHRLTDDTWKVMVQVTYEPRGILAPAADELGVTRSCVESCLEGFKRHLEMRGRESGAWRGWIPSEDEPGASTSTPLGKQPSSHDARSRQEAS